jgi:hypothetical protein
MNPELRGLLMKLASPGLTDGDAYAIHKRAQEIWRVSLLIQDLAYDTCQRILSEKRKSLAESLKSRKAS